MLDLDSRVEAAEAAEARRVDLDGRAEARALTVDEIQISNARRDNASSGYQPSKPAEIRAGLAGKEREAWAITLGRLWIDCGRAVSRWRGEVRCPKSHAENLQTDAMHLILRWPWHGGGTRADGTRAPLTDLGGRLPLQMARARAKAAEARHGRAYGVTVWIDAAERILTDGTLPRRADWCHAEDPRDLSPMAWRALHAAVRQAARKPEYVHAAATEETEISTEDPRDIDAAIDLQSVASGAAASTVPDVDAPETLAAIMDLPLDAARAIVARAYPAASVAALAADWRISEQSAKNALTRGAAAVRRAYPEAAALLAAVDKAANQWAINRAGDAAATLAGLRDGDATLDMARDAVGGWRAATAALDPQRVALLGAARAACLRHGGHYGGELAERIAASVPRLIRAEDTRAASHAHWTLPATSARVDGRTATEARLTEARRKVARVPHSGARAVAWISELERIAAEAATRETEASRVWTYGLDAATRRETLTPAAVANAERVPDSRAIEERRQARARQAEREETARVREARRAAEYEDLQRRQAAMRQCACQACTEA